MHHDDDLQENELTPELEKKRQEFAERIRLKILPKMGALWKYYRQPVNQEMYRRYTLFKKAFYINMSLLARYYPNDFIVVTHMDLCDYLWSKQIWDSLKENEKEFFCSRGYGMPELLIRKGAQKMIDPKEVQKNLDEFTEKFMPEMIEKTGKNAQEIHFIDE